MILPKGKRMYENLRTSFVDLNNMLLALKEEDFTGYIHLSFWDYEGVLFLESGEVVNAIEESKEGRRGGEEAVGNILHQAKVKKDGKIDVYILPSEMITLFASTITQEALYKDLSSDFTSLDKLIEKLRKEGHTGYVEISFFNGKGGGIIFFQDGDVIEAMVGMEGEEIISGQENLDKIVEKAQEAGAYFNVYRSSFEETRASFTETVQERDMETAIALMEDIMRDAERVLDSMAEGKGAFVESFRRAQLDISEKYPFLDPFVGEFEYKDGKLQFLGDVPVKEFIKGVGECLDLALEKMPIRASKGDIYNKIRPVLESTVEKYEEVRDRWDLRALLPNLLS